jgi:hypothetical protein
MHLSTHKKCIYQMGQQEKLQNHQNYSYRNLSLIIWLQRVHSCVSQGKDLRTKVYQTNPQTHSITQINHLFLCVPYKQRTNTVSLRARPCLAGVGKIFSISCKTSKYTSFYSVAATFCCNCLASKGSNQEHLHQSSKGCATA